MKVELRDGKELFFDGYVNAVERDSRVIHENGRVFVEQIKAGTWQRALDANPDVVLLFNHQAGRVLGKNGDKIRLYEDNIGLRIEGSTTDGEVVEAAKNHQLQGFSFGFRAISDHYEPIDEGLERRFVDELALREVSMLSKTPAYYGTQIYTRDEDVEVVSVRFKEEKQDELVSTNNAVNAVQWAGAALTSSPLRAMTNGHLTFADTISAPDSKSEPTPEPEPDYSAEYDQYKYI